MDISGYNEQEMDIWNMAFAQAFVTSVGHGRTDEEASAVALEVACRTVEAHRALMRRYGRHG